MKQVCLYTCGQMGPFHAYTANHVLNVTIYYLKNTTELSSTCIPGNYHVTMVPSITKVLTSTGIQNSGQFVPTSVGQLHTANTNPIHMQSQY
jgi:hypothetical protein